MKSSNLFKSLLWTIAGAVTLTWIACDPLVISDVDQPETAGYNEPFGVDITVFRADNWGDSTLVMSRIGMKLPAEWLVAMNGREATPYRLVFGIQLPAGWTVEDHINFTGADEGVFNYSGELSAGMESQYPPDPSYYWWVGEMPETIDTAYGEIFFTPVITTDEQQGHFYLDYSIGYWSDTALTLSSSRSHNHLITVGLPDTLYVTSVANSGPGSLRAAIDSVSQGGTILFDLLFYPATITLSEGILIYKSVNINGPKNGSLTLSGNNSCRIFHVWPRKSLGLANLEIANGLAPQSEGGAVFFNEGSSGIFIQSDFTNNHAGSSGGAIYGRNIEMLSLQQCLMSGNKAQGGDGGAVYLNNDSNNPGIFSLGNSEISGNNSSYGGAIYLDGSLTCHIYGSEITENESNPDGGGIYARYLNNLIISETNFHENTANYSGGGLFLYGIHNLDLDQVKIYENQANAGGGIILGSFDMQDTISFSAVTVRNNIAVGIGGGIFSQYDLNIRFDEINRCNIYSNWALEGPEWYHSGGQLNSIILPVILDTFTVIQPNDYFTWPLHVFNCFDIQHAAIQQIDQDVYVSPEGSNSNTGTSPSSPFKTISHALKFTIADPVDPNTIHLAPGTYSEQGNGENFPLYTRSATRISGQDEENTIIETMNSDYVFHLEYDQGVQFEHMNFEGILIQNSSVEAADFITSGINSYNSTVELTDGHVKVDGLSTNNSHITCNNVTFRDNHLAAWINDSTTMTLNGCMIENNGYANGYCQYKGGLRIGGESHLNLSGTTIRNNISPEPGGGIYFENATVWFDPVSRCNIYDNFADYGTDLYTENPEYYFEITVDTFSVLHPTDYYAFPRYRFNFNILNGKNPQVSADLYVSPDGSDDNSGLSPDDPLRSISRGLRMFLPDESLQFSMHLAPGTYSQDETGEHFPLLMPNCLTLSGAGKDTTLVYGTAGKNQFLFFNQYRDTIRNVSLQGENAEYEVAGLSIKNGQVHLENMEIFSHGTGIDITGACNLTADSAIVRNNRYGINTGDAQVKLENIEIAGNFIGINISDGEVECKNLLVRNNPGSDGWGGGIYARDAKLTLLHCDFLSNSSRGGYFYNCNGLMIGNLWKGNGYFTAGYSSGGGIYLDGCGNITFVNDQFENNFVTDRGGGAFVFGGFPVFAGCQFTDNHANSGGGIYFAANEGFCLVDCRLEQNVADGNGGGIFDNSENGYLSGTTIAYNLANKGGGIYYANYTGQYEWDDQDRCNIYLNNALMNGHDLYSENETAIHPVVVDTFTILDPTDQIAWHTYNFDFDILNGICGHEPGDFDIYVSPDGDDRNSGLSPQEALRTLNRASFYFTFDTLLPHTIHLAEGVYSHSQTGEEWPVEIFSDFEILGAGRESTILDGEHEHPLVSDMINPYGLSIKHLTLRNGNAGALGGGAIYCEAGNLELEDVTIDSCVADNGGAIYFNWWGTMNFNDVTLKRNRAANRGGALYTYHTDCRFRNVEFSNNTAESDGGAWYAKGYTICNAENTVFMQNGSVNGDSPDLLGGAIYLNNVSGSLRGLSLEKNSSKHGGAISLFNSSTDLVNMTFTENSASGDGGAVHARYSSHLGIYSNTFSANTATKGKDIALRQSSLAGLYNSIIAEDVPESVIDLYNGGVISFHYSDLVGGEASITQSGTTNHINWYEGNIDADPLFMGSGDYPYSLSAGSPCIDAGNPDTTGMNLPFWDLAGNYRLWDGDGDGDTIVDIGAFEFGSVGVGTEEFQIPSTKFQSNSKFQIEINPNPVVDRARICFSLESDAVVCLELFNSQGTKLDVIESRWFAEGENRLEWNASGLSPGIYLLRLSDGRNIEVNKIVKL